MWHGLRLPREAALRHLDLPPSGHNVLFSLGSMSNHDLGDLPALIVEGVLQSGKTPMILKSPLKRDSDSLAGLSNKVMTRQTYPIMPHLAAFGYAVSAAGYNSFHEFTAVGLPTIWVPNQAGEMDRQDLRARFACLAGTGDQLRSGDASRVAAVVARFDDAGDRRAMERRALDLHVEKGAAMVAAILDDFACMTTFGR